jgi:sugar/nucleoside kinase (ribokinase family)
MRVNRRIRRRINQSLRLAPEVVCFGMLIPAMVFIVDDLPEHNTGGVIKQVGEFISDDAAIIACLLRGWGVRSGLIGTSLGDDYRGRQVRQELRALGVKGRVRLVRGQATPYEVNVSDQTGARTYFWQRDPEVLATLDTADLGLIKGAKLLYVDWYDGEHIFRALNTAEEWGVPVFVNLEYGHQDEFLLSRLAGRTAICQAVTDPAQRDGADALSVARKLLAAGMENVIVTMAGAGCLAARQGEGHILHVQAPPVPVVDGCGAGATFSAGFATGFVRGWPLEDTVRFAVAAASLKITTVGPQAFPRAEVKRLAAHLSVEHLPL